MRANFYQRIQKPSVFKRRQRRAMARNNDGLCSPVIPTRRQMRQSKSVPSTN